LQVHHSYPLEPSERQELALSITKLHATAFTTPSFFVNVRFISHDASDKSYFIAGKSREDSTNRILGYVRTSSSRTKADFDSLAEKIEDAWKAAVYGPLIEEGKEKGKREKEVDESERSRLARKLLVVAFVPMVAVREGGLAIPEAGKEAAWFKENMKHFQEQSELGNEDYTEMLRELKERDDLKKMTQGGGLSGLLDSINLGGGGKDEKKENADGSKKE
jgi:Putative oxalocrotonate tautomerase enzyme